MTPSISSLVLQSGFDVHVPGVTRTQWAIGVFGVILALAIVLIVRHRGSYWGLSEDQRAVRATVRLALLEQTPTLLQLQTFRYRDDGYHGPGESLQAALEERFDAAARDDGDVVGRARARQLGGRLRHSIGVAWQDRVADIPSATLAALRWAALVTVFGMLAVSTGLILAFLSADPASPTPGEYWHFVSSGAATTASTLLSLFAAFPYADVLWAFGFTAVFMAAELLYRHWYVVAALLVAAAGAVYALDRRAENIPEQVVERPSHLAAAGLAAVLLVWSVGTAIAELGRAAGYPHAAEALGFLLAAGTLFLLLSFGVRAARDRGVFQFGWTDSIHDASQTDLAYLVAIRSVGVLSGVAAILVLLYAFIAVATGRLTHIAVAFIHAAPEIQLATLVSVLAVAGALAWQVRVAFPDARTVARRLLDQQVARLQVAAIGVPVGGVIATYVLVSSLTHSIPIALAAGILVGLMLRRGMNAGLRFAHGVDWAALATPPPNPWLTVRQWVVTPTDSDGNERATQYISEVNGRRIAHTDREQAIEDTIELIDAIADSEIDAATESKWHGEFLLERGLTSHDETIEKLEEKVRKRAFGYLREHGPKVGRDEFDRILESYPDDIAERRLRELNDWIYRDDQVVVLRGDPYAGRINDEKDRIAQELKA